MKAAAEELLPTVLSGCEHMHVILSTCQVRCACWYNSGVVFMSIINYLGVRFSGLIHKKEFTFGTLSQVKSSWLEGSLALVGK